MFHGERESLSPESRWQGVPLRRSGAFARRRHDRRPAEGDVTSSSYRGMMRGGNNRQPWSSPTAARSAPTRFVSHRPVGRDRPMHDDYWDRSTQDCAGLGPSCFFNDTTFEKDIQPRAVHRAPPFPATTVARRSRQPGVRAWPIAPRRVSATTTRHRRQSRRSSTPCALSIPPRTARNTFAANVRGAPPPAPEVATRNEFSGIGGSGQCPESVSPRHGPRST